MRAALYARVSSTNQETDGTSLGTQEARCRAHASDRHYHVDEAHVYREVHTGTELWERTQLTKLRQAIRHREIDVAIVYAIDRLSRDPVHLGVVLSEADHAGVQVEFVTEPLDASPEGQLIRFVRGYAAKIEHEKIRERAMRGQLARIQSGRLLGAGKPLYGYRWRDHTRSALDIDPVTGRVARRVFADVASGKALRRLATELTAEGVPTPTGKTQWSIQTLHDILHHPNYTGRARAWWRRPLGKAKVNRFDEAEAVELPEGTIPPLVDETTWEAVQQRLTLNKLQSPRNNRHPLSMLLRTGFARCGYCGRALTGKTRNDRGGVVTYRCTRILPHTCRLSIDAKILDAAVWERVEAILTRPEIVAREIERLRKDDPTEADLAAVDKSVAEVERQLANMTDAISMAINADALATLVARLDQESAQKSRLLEEREGILRRREAWLSAESQLGSLTEWCRTVAARLGHLTYEEKRLALEALGVQATVYRKDHDPRYVITASIPMDGSITSETPRAF